MKSATFRQKLIIYACRSAGDGYPNIHAGWVDVHLYVRYRKIGGKVLLADKEVSSHFLAKHGQQDYRNIPVLRET